MHVLGVEDQPVFRTVIERFFNNRLGQVKISWVESASDAMRCLEEQDLRLVLADFSTGDVGEPEGFEQIVASAVGTPVIALDRRVSPAHVRRARAAGAKAYIAKTSTSELLEAGIGVVMAGGEYFPSRDPEGVDAHDGRVAWVRSLSPRQSWVLRLLSEGKTNKEIAAQLGLALPTVKLHTRAILRAAGARNRTEAVLKAMPR
jgi:DNA-binding NarL/FixJ family response regulator